MADSERPVLQQGLDSDEFDCQPVVMRRKLIVATVLLVALLVAPVQATLAQDRPEQNLPDPLPAPDRLSEGQVYAKEPYGENAAWLRHMSCLTTSDGSTYFSLPTGASPVSKTHSLVGDGRELLREEYDYVINPNDPSMTEVRTRQYRYGEFAYEWVDQVPSIRLEVRPTPRNWRGVPEIAWPDPGAVQVTSDPARLNVSGCSEKVGFEKSVPFFARIFRTHQWNKWYLDTGRYATHSWQYSCEWDSSQRLVTDLLAFQSSEPETVFCLPANVSLTHRLDLSYRSGVSGEVTSLSMATAPVTTPSCEFVDVNEEPPSWAAAFTAGIDSDNKVTYVFVGNFAHDERALEWLSAGEDSTTVALIPVGIWPGKVRPGMGFYYDPEVNNFTPDRIAGQEVSIWDIYRWYLPNCWHLAPEGEPDPDVGFEIDPESDGMCSSRNLTVVLDQTGNCDASLVRSPQDGTDAGQALPANVGGTTTPGQPSTSVRLAAHNPQRCGHKRHPFSDVPKGSFFEVPANCLAERDVVRGSAGSLIAARPISRSEVALMLHRTAGRPSFTTECEPEDLGRLSGHLRESVCWLRGTAISNSATFRPQSQLTRAEMAALIWRLAGEPAAPAICGFRDQSRIPQWAREATCFLKENGITTEQTFNPQGLVTRAQMTAFIYRYGLYRGTWLGPNG